MKKYIRIKWGLMLCLICGLFMTPNNRMQVRADEIVATVQGSVMKGTTTDLLKLATKEGNMEIKLDSGTDTSACKILLPGSDLSVSVSHGSDGYLHAVKIASGSKGANLTFDSSTNATVTGTISEKSKDDVLYVKTVQGDMEIKIDSNTDMSGCSVIVANKTYRITCVRGSDAYMHATGITEASSTGQVSSEGSSVAADSSLTPAPSSQVGVDTSTVTGTVNKKTKADLMYLDTSYGEMQVVIDANTDSRNGMFLMPGAKLTVSVYRGSDAYMHAAVIVGAKNVTQPPEIDTSSPSTVTGTVDGKSTENTLYLKTSAGEMELKLDAVRSVTGCKVLVKDRKITVTCARGSDAYMHALDITGN